jgi:hypothetical protein
VGAAGVGNAQILDIFDLAEKRTFLDWKLTRTLNKSVDRHNLTSGHKTIGVRVNLSGYSGV